MHCLADNIFQEVKEHCKKKEKKKKQQYPLEKNDQFEVISFLFSECKTSFTVSLFAETCVTQFTEPVASGEALRTVQPLCMYVRMRNTQLYIVVYIQHVYSSTHAISCSDLLRL